MDTDLPFGHDVTDSTDFHDFTSVKSVESVSDKDLSANQFVQIMLLTLLTILSLRGTLFVTKQSHTSQEEIAYPKDMLRDRSASSARILIPLGHLSLWE